MVRPEQRRGRGRANPDADNFDTWLDAVHTALLVYAEDGAPACEAFLKRTGLRHDATFRACLQAMINAVPRTQVGGKFARPEAALLEPGGDRALCLRRRHAAELAGVHEALVLGVADERLALGRILALGRLLVEKGAPLAGLGELAPDAASVFEDMAEGIRIFAGLSYGAIGPLGVMLPDEINGGVEGNEEGGEP